MAITWERVKDPDDVVDYQADWSAVMADMGDDTIATSTWEDITSGIVKDSDSKTDTTATIWLSGGTAGTTYSMTNRVVTTGGRTLDQTYRVKVKAR